MSHTLENIASILGGACEGPSERIGAVPGGFSIDTRTIRPGDLFFAIVGPNHDGHRFAAQAAEKGASGLIVSDRGAIGAAAGVPVIVVKDTLRALQDLAASVRREMPARVVGITGSGGKTTTKEMTRAALESSFTVHSSRGNLNNLYGCPLSLLELKSDHQVSVLEMGMSYHGELARLAEIADPDIGVLTNVSAAHLMNFTSVEDVASAKQELFDGMRSDAIGIFNADNEHCRRIAGAFKGFARTFGIDHEADLRASNYRMNGLSGCTFEVRHAQNGGSRTHAVSLRFVGIHHVYNALAAMSAGYMLGIDLDAIADRLSQLVPLGMRGRVLALRGPIECLDDSYNSNPDAMHHMLRVLADAEPAAGGRKIIVFGDMLELGDYEKEAHREIGRMIGLSDAAIIVGVGRLAVEALDEARSTAKGEVHHFDEATGAAAFVVQSVRPGDLVFVKASRGIGLDRVVGALEERFGEE